ncbi:MAG: DUF5320 domain-containing protein [Bacillota bacterium]
MPGRDGTGPKGHGSMTGRGLGYCAAGQNAQNGNGLGLGLGRGFRWGCRGNFSAVPAQKYKELLTEQKKRLERRVAILNEKLENL